MWLCEAIARCPHLCVLPYDFIDYEHVLVFFSPSLLLPLSLHFSSHFSSSVQVSKQIFAIFIKYTPFVQVVSCDEALLDLSTLSDISHVEDCVRRIREEVVTVTGCTCSAGIGSNPLLARLALRKAKGFSSSSQFHSLVHSFTISLFLSLCIDLDTSLFVLMSVAMGPNQQFTAPNIMDREHLLEWIGQFSVGTQIDIFGSLTFLSSFSHVPAALPGVGTKTQLQLRELGYDLISSLQHVEMVSSSFHYAHFSFLHLF
jgi:hypothetical protein